MGIFSRLFKSKKQEQPQSDTSIQTGEVITLRKGGSYALNVKGKTITLCGGVSLKVVRVLPDSALEVRIVPLEEPPYLKMNPTIKAGQTLRIPTELLIYVERNQPCSKA
jgi:hypothetical protein